MIVQHNEPNLTDDELTNRLIELRKLEPYGAYYSANGTIDLEFIVLLEAQMGIGMSYPKAFRRATRNVLKIFPNAKIVQEI